MSSLIFMKEVMNVWCKRLKAITKLLRITVRNFQEEVCANSFSKLNTGNRENSTNYLNILLCIQENRLDKLNRKTSTPPPHDQIAVPMSEIQIKAEMKNKNKIQVKANTAIQSFLLIFHEISWLYTFQSTFPAPFTKPSKRLHLSFQCNKRF